MRRPLSLLSASVRRFHATMAPPRRCPRSVHPLLRTVPAIFALLLAAGPTTAQQPAAQPAQGLKTLTLDDYPTWSRVSGTALSPDGKWMAWAVTPNEGDGTLHIRLLDGETTYEIERGSGPEFSSDSRRVTYTINPPGQAGSGRGGRGGGRGGAPPAQAAGRERGASGTPRTLQLLDLSTGAKFDVTDPQSSAFSEDARFLAVRRSTGGGDGYRGTDLLVRDLESGTVRNIGNVSDFAFNEPGTLLAWTVDASQKAGNGLYVMDPRSGVVRALDTDTLRYERLAWDEDGTALAALRGEKPDSMEQRANTLAAFTSLSPAALGNLTSGATSSRRNGAFVYDPSADATFPAGHVLSELGTVEWSRDGSRIFLGIKEQQHVVTDTAVKANVNVWHWADERLQSVQMVRASADQRFTYAAVVHVPSGRFVRLADADMPRVEPTRDGRIAIGRRDAPYRLLQDEQGGLQDIVKIDVGTGERTTLLERIRYSLDVSPDGRWHAYSKDGTLYLQDVATGQSKDLTALAGTSFASDETGDPGETRTYGIAGWSRDGRSILVNAKYDVWMLPVTGSAKPVNLTAGIGQRDDIRFRLQGLDTDPDAEPGIDTSKPVLLSAYGEWTKMSGYWTVQAGKEPRPLIWEDRQVGQVRKAENADRVMFTRQTFEEFPDWWVSDTRFSNPTKVTDANPQQAEYAWGSRTLIDYTDQRGNKLQATLTLPAGYEPGRRYPMLVYFYEKLSQNHHAYSMPTYDDRPHMSAYASDGYLVLMPDIVYDVGKPGSSALDDVTSAVRKVVELGYADPAHIGAQGHSWGGYESSFIVTQTDLFAAVVTGAPLTDLESMHNILYKQSGGGNAPLIQWGQGRMGTVPWNDPDSYGSQSPVRFVENITTPFLILQGTADGAVDWNQGLEFYVAARRAGKQVILLSYPDEPHHLAKKDNQIDFQIRMKQFFDHYLKDAPAPAWMTEGVPYLDRAREERGKD